MATKYIDFTLPDVKLTNDHRVITCEVEYSPRNKAIILSMMLVTKEGGMTSYMLYGSKNRQAIIEDAPRYNAKKVQDIGNAMLEDIKMDKRSWGLGKIYFDALQYIEENNGVTVAKTDEEAFKVPSFVIGEVVRKVHAATINVKPVYGVVVGMTNDYGGLRYQVLYQNGHLYSYEKAVDTSASLESLGKVLSGESVERLLTAHQTKEAKANAAQLEAKAIETRAYEAALSNLREKYPFAKREGSHYARAAANCKAELQREYPGVAFSVTSQSYSGGDSMQVGWTNGPTVEAVRAISQKYQDVSHMDQTDYCHSKTGPEHKAVQEHLGTCRYVRESRRISDEVRETVRAQIVHTYGEFPDHDRTFGLDRVLERSTIFGAFKGWADEGKEITAIFEENTASAVEPEPFTGNDEVTVTENPTKNGIEIRFAGKPDADTIERVKRQGFRWSKFQKMWYAQISDSRRSFANELAGA